MGGNYLLRVLRYVEGGRARSTSCVSMTSIVIEGLSLCNQICGSVTFQRLPKWIKKSTYLVVLF